jgi:hypothetical protein
MRLAIRYATLIALMFWQGGFTFYASIVVPVSTEVLNSSLRQGFISQAVTYRLNISAACALAVLALDLTCTCDPSRIRKWIRWGLWLGMALCQGLLFWLHDYLNGFMVSKGLIILDPEAFRPAHRAYLWLHTVQWALGLVFVGLMLRAWQREDTAALPTRES